MSLPRLVAVSALATVAVAWFVFPSNSAPDAKGASTRGVTSTPGARTVITREVDNSGEIDALRAEVRALAAQQPDRPPVDAPPATPEEEAEMMTDLAVHFDQTLEAEVADPEWGAGMRTRVQGYFETQPGAQVREVDCRFSLCRVDVHLEDTAARDEMARRASDLLEPEAELFGYVENPEDLDVTLYLSRGGMKLPPM